MLLLDLSKCLGGDISLVYLQKDEQGSLLPGRAMAMMDVVLKAVAAVFESATIAIDTPFSDLVSYYESYGFVTKMRVEGRLILLKPAEPDEDTDSEDNFMSKIARKPSSLRAKASKRAGWGKAASAGTKAKRLAAYPYLKKRLLSDVVVSKVRLTLDDAAVRVYEIIKTFDGLSEERRTHLLAARARAQRRLASPDTDDEELRARERAGAEWEKNHRTVTAFVGTRRSPRR